MNTYVLGNYDRFRCIASACPDTCCTGWDVVIDDDTAQKYSAFPGELGVRMRACMHTDADGDIVFARTQPRCPFLQTDGLCEIQRVAGEQALSVTCRRFPRIVQEYEDFTECCLSPACPEGARLTLAQGALEVPMTQTNDADLQQLLQLRGELVRIVRDPAHSVAENLQQCLRSALAWNGVPQGECVSDAIGAQFRFYAALDLMTETFAALCRAPRPEPHVDRAVLENLAVYFLFRYLPQAVTDMDAALRVQLMCAAVLFVTYADASPLTAARLFAKEVEHSYENMERLYDALLDEPAFSPASLCAQISALRSGE